ncbi:bifunctional diguanylate cyclase/phosphodiesterase [Spirochaetia bacterium 38H-sp]|uniref:Bifunctional diguanylate cyclase/phosphodiesterase n=1 Tax=Rarispira pelagica TaxID=3141764 RepID=A0ABU9UBI8_9SPIR
MKHGFSLKSVISLFPSLISWFISVLLFLFFLPVWGMYSLVCFYLPFVVSFYKPFKYSGIVLAVLTVSFFEMLRFTHYSGYMFFTEMLRIIELSTLGGGVVFEILRRHKKELRELRKEFGFTIDTADEGFFRYLPHKDVFIMSKRFCALFDIGVEPDVAYPSSVLFENLHPDDVELAKDTLRNISDSPVGKRFSIDVRVENRDKKLRYVRLYGLSYMAENGSWHPVVVGFMEDISHEKELENQVDILIHKNKITGLDSVESFYEKLGKKITSNNTARFSLLVVSPVNIDEITDLYGHPVRNALLREIALRFDELKREEDQLFHIDDTKFLFVINGSPSQTEIAVFAQRVMDSFSRPFIVQNAPVYIIAAVGVSIYPDDATEIAKLLQHAETALHQAVKNKSGFCFYSDDIHEESTRKMRRLRDIRKALRDREFELYYQPLVNAYGMITGAEALIRWNHPEEGLLPPSSFIDIAEDTGAILPIGQWVIQEACSAWRRWQDKGLPPLTMSINLSPQQLKDNGLLTVLMDSIHNNGVNPEYISLEITERSFLENAGQDAFFREVENIGVGISLDDFGTGYSTFQYIKEYPVKSVKINRSFVTGLPHKGEDLAIIHAILTLAEGLGLTVIAEGVETEQQIFMLKQFNCHIFQGFYYSRPLPEKDFISLVKSSK